MVSEEHTYINESEAGRYDSSELEEDDAHAQHAEGRRRRRHGNCPLSGGGEAVGRRGELEVEAEDGGEEDGGAGEEEDGVVGGDCAAAAAAAMVSGSSRQVVIRRSAAQSRAWNARATSAVKVRAMCAMRIYPSMHDGTRWLSY